MQTLNYILKIYNSHYRQAYSYAYLFLIYNLCYCIISDILFQNKINFVLRLMNRLVEFRQNDIAGTLILFSLIK